MSLLELPVEIILQIASYLDEGNWNYRYAHINSFARTNRRLYDIVDPFLYRLDAQKGGGDFNYGNAIPFALGKEGPFNTVRKTCQAGAGFDDLLPIAVTVKQGLEWTTVLLDEDMWSENPRTDPNVLDSRGETVLERAAKDGYTNIVRSLLARGASAQPNSQTPMHSAVINRDPEMVKLFLNRNDVDVNAIFNGRTPLHLAVKANRRDLVELLLGDEQVDVNLTGMNNGRTPLLDAAILNNSEVIQQLLSAGADPNVADRTGLSPAMLMGCFDVQGRDELLKRHPEGPPPASEERKKKTKNMHISSPRQCRNEESKS